MLTASSRRGVASPDSLRAPYLHYVPLRAGGASRRRAHHPGAVGGLHAADSCCKRPAVALWPVRREGSLHIPRLGGEYLHGRPRCQRRTLRDQEKGFRFCMRTKTAGDAGIDHGRTQSLPDRRRSYTHIRHSVIQYIAWTPSSFCVYSALHYVSLYYP
ncbi:hypothetical protein GE09DRAFT_1129712 [Coniochaeta sp. 2T2.1]|nr:hypothetical protein GE09DRAFT_1129712 [Coniochaeta sp. 2T2.1]